MFVAVWPDDLTAQRLSALQLSSGPGVKAVRPERWHVTLRFLGDVDDALLPKLVDALEHAATRVPCPVHCTIGPATAWFSGARVLQIPVAGLDEVAESVRNATVSIVAGPGQAQFVGHLTVARVRGRRPASSTWADVAGIAFTAEFAVRHLLLVASELSPEGPRYSTLAQFALGAGGPLTTA
jgi:RNA 2',3'-cyclic 3'-phosphodiesterase